MKQSVKLVITLLWVLEEKYTAALKKLAEEFGPYDFKGEIKKFDITDYYKSEMGDGEQKKQIISFQKHINAEDAVKIKESTVEIEKSLSQKNCRTVNIDPGYIDLNKLVLFSCKEQAMKLYYGSGIYADIIMEYSKRKWKKFPWTFADFKDSTYDAECTRIRDLYKSNLKNS